MESSPRYVLATRSWWAAAGVRALKTFVQAILALVATTAAGVMDVDWVAAASAGALAAIISLLTSLAGLPETTDTAPLEAVSDE